MVCDNVYLSLQFAFMCAWAKKTMYLNIKTSASPHKQSHLILPKKTEVNHRNKANQWGLLLVIQYQQTYEKRIEESSKKRKPSGRAAVHMQETRRNSVCPFH